MCVFECRFLHKSTVTTEAKKGVSDSLKAKLQMAVSCPIWVLGAKLGSSARVVHS